MRNLAIGLCLAAVGAAAMAQGPATAWGAFEQGDIHGVGVQGEGSQLLLKCDKPGRNSVYALMLTDENLLPPGPGFQMRSAELRFDDKTPLEDRWRFYEKYVVAINKDGERSLTRLLTGLNDAQAVEVRLYPERGKSKVVTLKFNVAGAKDAITQVYESCKDTNPAA